MNEENGASENADALTPYIATPEIINREVAGPPPSIGTRPLSSVRRTPAWAGGTGQHSFPREPVPFAMHPTGKST
jgi:hypothetical protein